MRIGRRAKRVIVWVAWGIHDPLFWIAVRAALLSSLCAAIATDVPFAGSAITNRKWRNPFYRKGEQ